MPRFARLFEAADEILDNFRDALRRRDVEALLKLWMDEDSVSCVLPNGQRLSGHAQLREAFAHLLHERAVYCDVVDTVTHASLGVTIFEVCEALRFSAQALEAELYVHTTYVLMQNHEGWRIAHMHSSPAHEVEIGTPHSVSHSLH